MCTVTIIPKGKDGFILTSNRDEAPSRVSSAPDLYATERGEFLFPKDELSGGTWIGVSDKKRVLCVLNGAFELHERKSGYRVSRGKVALDLLQAQDIFAAISSYSFEGIEAFTIVIADWNIGLQFVELVWDGNQKHVEKLPLEPRIWSSSTLYNKVMRAERKQWFNDFKSSYKQEAEAVLHFHKTAGYGNLDYGVIMDRGFVKTTSITQIEKQADVVEMHYENLVTDRKSFNVFKFPQAVNG